MTAPSVSVVIPTVGRETLGDLLWALDGDGPLPGEIIIVDDQAQRDPPLQPAVPPALAPLVRLVPGRAAGPAAARNAGWRAATGEWVAFLDDDVLPESDWLARLAKDLAQPSDVGGNKGVITVPLPSHRRPTDWERSTAALADARWITADMAYRRSVLEEVGGFDERFPRAYREDSDLAIRVQRAGHRLVVGERRVVHPVRAESPWVSVRRQRGNADDALMRALHGANWRSLVGAPRGRLRRHILISSAGSVALLLAARHDSRRAAMLPTLLWAAGTAEFAWVRIAPGPRTPSEIGTMLATSLLIPPVATYHRIRGILKHRGTRLWRGPQAGGA